MALQREKKRRAEVKVGVAYSGKEGQATLNKVIHLALDGGEPFWQGLTVKVAKVFNLAKLGKTTIGGDGAAFVRIGQRLFPDASFVTAGLIDYRKRIRDPNKEMRGLGAIESNIDEFLANRMKKRGMAWAYSGAHHMAKVIQMLANGESVDHRAQEVQEKIAKQIRRSISKALEADPAAWVASRMPALVGPHQSRPWAKALRNLSRVATAGTQL